MKRVLSALIVVLAVQVSWGSALGLPAGRTTTTTSTNFPGIVDNKPLMFHVFGADVLPVEPTTSPNVIGGLSGSSAASASLTAAVAHLYYASTGIALGNTVSYIFATVGGGFYNSASGKYATVGGGRKNEARSNSATVGGGSDNNASKLAATIGGGTDNDASGEYATVGGGTDNTASGDRATVGGGDDNTASKFAATVGGGTANKAKGSSATVGGGDGNEAIGKRATVGGGTAFHREPTSAVPPNHKLNGPTFSRGWRLGCAIYAACEIEKTGTDPRREWGQDEH